MSLTSLTLPTLSAFDPPQSGEGSIDPMGLAALSDRLADQLVPGMRARMRHVRFTTAMAVSAVVCERLYDEIAVDGITTPQLCFEWVVVEAFARRPGGDGSSAIPGIQKARTIIASGQRLSAATYLKGPRVFGFHGVYKPFAIDARVVNSDLSPGARSLDLVQAWESENQFDGFVDDRPGSTGARLRRALTEQVIDALRTGHVTFNPARWSHARLSTSFDPTGAGPAERRVLRELVERSDHEHRDELSRLIQPSDDSPTDRELLRRTRRTASPDLRRIIDAILSYEDLACLLDSAFRTLCAMSGMQGGQPLTREQAGTDPAIAQLAARVPPAFARASESLERIELPGAAASLDARLGTFGLDRAPAEFAEALLRHHEETQAAKVPAGKRSWFEPFGQGWIVRPPYGADPRPEDFDRVIHPIRLDTLHRFLNETRP